MNIILIQLGLRPVQFEVPRQEYMTCLNHYYETGEIQPFEDLRRAGSWRSRMGTDGEGDFVTTLASATDSRILGP